MGNWSELSTKEREAKVRDLARQDMTEGQIEALLGAPVGSIRSIARRMQIILQSDRQRKAAEAAGDRGATLSGGVWAVDEDRRRVLVARRASRAAREALRAFR